jgi:hypothetical protein
VLLNDVGDLGAQAQVAEPSADLRVKEGERAGERGSRR